ncbi:S53 family peptidase [Alicyclobacillus fodiniaquatilis]|uniref:Protease pro-enzyme activation domain-containing protein n=1 Tax=Alicyclobacillus fodiniaquatilis TaxID=1661150 RepID=A0ABW4JGX2_9BACL
MDQPTNNVVNDSSRIPLVGSDRTIVPGAKRIGLANPADHITVTLILRRRSTSNLDDYIAELSKRPPAKRQHLSHAEFEAAHGADPADIALVKLFAEAHQLTVERVNTAARTVVLSGALSSFTSAFQVDLYQFEHPSFTYRGHTGPIHIPSHLHEIVIAVLGLDNRPQARTHFRIRTTEARTAEMRATATEPVTYTPPQVAALYNFPSVDCTGQCIGIIELGGGYQTNSIQTYFSDLGLPAPNVTSVSVDGATNQPTGDANGPDGEVELDIEVAASVAPGVHTSVYFTANTDAGFLDAITTAIHDTTNHPSVLSISWGAPESSWTQQAMQSMNSAFQDAAALGITVCVAAGDNGSTDNVGDGKVHVDFPASSPYALACGGTSLTATGEGTIESEVVWNDGANGGATGGGVSDVFALPSWQQNAGVPPSANSGGQVGRGVPDVAGDADPDTGYQILVDGQQYAMGGTSAVAPLWAGLIAIANQQLGHAVGYLNPTLYSLGSDSDAFHDITSGNNDIADAPDGAYQAKAGWDPCTGLGSPVGQMLITALTQNQTSQ